MHRDGRRSLGSNSIQSSTSGSLSAPQHSRFAAFGVRALRPDPKPSRPVRPPPVQPSQTKTQQPTTYLLLVRTAVIVSTLARKDVETILLYRGTVLFWSSR